MRSASGLIPVAVVVSLVPAATVSAGTLSGRITATGGIDPKTEAGTVRAVRLRSLTLAAAARTDRRGRFRLAVPSGSYAVLGAVPSLRGKSLASAVSLAKVRSGRGTRVVMRTRQGAHRDPCKQGSGRRRAICRRARTRGLAQASAARPTVAIETFTSRGDNPVAGRALSEWLTTDLYRAASGDCRPQVVERTRLKDLLDEMLLQQQPYFDPGTRRVFTPPKVDFVVRGSATSSGSALSWSLELIRSGSGKVVLADRSGATGTAALTASEGIARRFAEAVCREDAPLSYVGTFGGSATYEGGSITETWNATDVVYELEFTGDYRLRSGALTWSISGSTDDSRGHCTYSGSGSFDLSYARGTLSAREGFYSVNAGGAPPTPWPVLVECTELEPETQESGGYGSGPTGRWLNSGGTLSNQGMLRPFEGGHLTGSLSGEGEGAAVAWHWDFMAK
jgi:TolB-like protein